MAPPKKKALPATPADGLSRFDQLLASDLVKNARKAYGSLALIPASQHPVLRNRRHISTGIYSLDVALGGGWPAGRMSTIFGNPSTGKTAAATKTIATFQCSCAVCCRRVDRCECDLRVVPVVAFIDLEGTLDLEWAESQGVDIDRLMYVAPSSAEEALEVLDSLVLSGLCDFIVYDSLALTVPRKTIEEREIGQALPGSQAKILTEGLARVTLSQNRMGNKDGRRPTVLFLNQLRTQIGVMYGDPHIQAGGNAVKFMPSVIVKTSGGKVSIAKSEDGFEYPERAEWACRIVKNKTAAPRMEAEAFIQLTTTDQAKAGDFIDAHVMFEDGKRFGLIEGGGSSFTFLGEKGSPGELKLRMHLDIEFRHRAYDTLMAAHFSPATEEPADAAPVEPQPAG